uniref:Uncharacterized protein n=1 Tax=Strongyloides venezuelensis TaxID=75913 RepID=A0A0K0EY35_STRVS
MIALMVTFQVSIGAPNRVMMRFGKRFTPIENDRLLSYHRPLLQYEGSSDNNYKFNSYLHKNPLFPVIIDNN